MAYIRPILLLVAGVAILGAEANVLDKRGLLSCEPVLTPQVCQKWRNIALNLGLSAGVINDAVKASFMHGASSTKDIIDYVKAYVKNLATNTKCDDLLGKEDCDKIRDIAKKFKVKVDLVDKVVKDAIIAGKDDIPDIINYSKEMLQTYIQCELWLKDSTCKAIRNIALEFSRVTVKEVEQKLAEIIASGRPVTSDIYQEIFNYFQDKYAG